MTRQEFIDNVENIDELREFCDEIDYDLEGVYTEEDRDERILDEVSDMVHDCNWYDIRNFLDNQPTGYDFYYCDDWNEWEGRNYTDIDDFKNAVLEYCDDNGLFDEEEEEEIEEFEEDEEDDEEPVELGCDMNDFFNSGNDTMRQIRERAEAEAREYDEAMQKFLNTKIANAS